MRSIQEMTKSLIQILNKLRIDYVIVGGMAVNAWGNIRTTRDVDIIISLKKQDIHSLMTALHKKDFSVTEHDIQQALMEKTHFTVFDTSSQYHVDIKGVYEERDRRTLQTRKKITFLGTEGFFASPEDSIANKLLFGSEQDIKDAESIYVRQLENLDMEYLSTICKKMNVFTDLVKMQDRIKKHLK